MKVTHDQDIAPLATAIGTAVAVAIGSGGSEEKVVRFKYDTAAGGTNVTSAAYVQLVAATSRTYTGLEIFDSSGFVMILAFGAPAAEVDQFYILPGGNGKLNQPIPIGTRISIKAAETTADSGEIVLNGKF